MRFVVDEQIRPFDEDIRHDLTGTGAQACPILSTGLFIVHEHTVPKGTAEIVTGIFPHCWARTNPGSPQESIALLAAIDVAGWVLFDTSKANNQPFPVSNNYNQGAALATANDRARDVVRGTTFLANDGPLLSATNMQNPLRMIYLPAESVFRVLFRLAPVLTVAEGGVPNPFVIGAAGVAGKRIDFAGALVTGVRMPQELYESLVRARRDGMLGPEA
jgi:hypothetical protein